MDNGTDSDYRWDGGEGNGRKLRVCGRKEEEKDVVVCLRAREGRDERRASGRGDSIDCLGRQMPVQHPFLSL